jgi:hypothetical protein
MKLGAIAAGAIASLSCLMCASSLPAGTMPGWEGEKKLDDQLGYGVGKVRSCPAMPARALSTLNPLIGTQKSQ